MILSDGRTIPPTFRQFTYGYAATSHSAQGKTVDHGLLLMADEGIRSGHLRQAYVSNSRFRDRQTIFTTDKAGAREAMARPGERLLAMELNEKAQAEKPSRLRKLMEMAEAWRWQLRRRERFAAQPKVGPSIRIE